MVRLGDHVIAIGGALDSLNLEIFDLGTNSWIDVWPLPEPRSGHCSVVLDAYHVMLVGGGGQGGMNQTKVLDTLTGTWTTYPDIPAGRASGHACIKTQVDFQPDSEAGVMVTGGRDWQSAAGDLYPGRRVDFFSLKNHTWTQLGDSSFSQWEHKMTILDSASWVSDRGNQRPVIIGGEYKVDSEEEIDGIHQRNFVQTFDNRDHWFCCIPQLKWKRAYFQAVKIELNY